MTTFARRTFDCPTCGAQAERDVVVTLNGGRRPDLRDALLDGSFQGWRCEACGEPYRVDDPFVYVDFGRKQWITRFPAAREREWPALESEPLEDWRQAMVTHAAPAARAMSAGMRVRAVFGGVALREKLVAFELGIDDGWLEVLKLDLLRTPELGLGFHPDKRPRLVHADADHLAFDVPSGRFSVPRARLVELQTDALEWSSAYEALTRGAYVDVGRILLAPPR